MNHAAFDTSQRGSAEHEHTALALWTYHWQFLSLSLSRDPVYRSVSASANTSPATTGSSPYMLHFRIFDPAANAASVASLVRLLNDRRALLLEMTRREVSDRYAGQVLGSTWALIMPLLTVGIYIFTFAFIFKGRLAGGDNGLGYVAFLLAGLVPWMALADGLGRASTGVTAHANLVKQIVFPSEILPMKIALATLPSLVIGLSATLAVSFWAGLTTIFGTFVLLPIAVACLLLMIAGIGFALAALGVFVRDVKDIVNIFLSLGLFVHPILYPPSSVPAWLTPFFQVSPFSHLIWCFRDALIATEFHPWSWIICPFLSITFFAIGSRLFRTLKPSFGNAL